MRRKLKSRAFCYNGNITVGSFRARSNCTLFYTLEAVWKLKTEAEVGRNNRV